MDKIVSPNLSSSLVIQSKQLDGRISLLLSSPANPGCFCLYEGSIQQLEGLVLIPVLVELLIRYSATPSELYSHLQTRLAAFSTENNTVVKLSIAHLDDEGLSLIGGQEENGVLMPELITIKHKESIQLSGGTYLGVDLSSEYVHSYTGEAYWNIAFKMDPDTLRRVNPVPFVSALFSNSPVFSNESSILSTVFAELYSNSLEHGLLGIESELKKSPEGMVKYYKEREERLKALKSGYLNILLGNHFSSKSSGCLEIVFEDTGKGFDFERVFNKENTANQQYFGRGFNLIQSVCSSVNFDKGGRKVTVTYSYDM